MTDIWALGRLDASGQAALVADRTLSALELTDAALARIDALEPALNAISWRAIEQARADAAAFDRRPVAGPLAGVPYLVKDSLDYPGMPTRSGSRARQPVVATRALALAQAYRRAGLIAVGKSTMPEFALLPSTEPVLGGTTVNPWNAAVSVGGSSGGAAAAVAAGLVPVAHASDGAGSIRIPAACCGLVGLKPSRGANLRARGPHALEDLLTGDSLLARSVADVAAGFVVGGGNAAAMPGHPLRIALILTAPDGSAPHPAVAAAVQETARHCAALGHRVEPAQYPFPPGLIVAAFRVAWAYLGGEVVDQCRAVRGSEADGLLEPWTLSLADRRAAITPDRLEAMATTLGMLPALMAEYFQRYDCILSPVLRDPPAALGRMAGTRDPAALWDDIFGYVSYTPLHNLAGLPAISIPASYGEEGPIGAMLAAGRGGDGLLLDLAAQLEPAMGWRDRWPAVVTAASSVDTRESA